ncbi:MAG: endonuclease domain-containing protein [Lewinellaceae bacterium]|nr:endonuclease domain-containing protein [Lewinellaceae bacterium]
MTYAEILTFARELRKRQTPAEQKFWKQVRGRRFEGKKFLRQHIIKHAMDGKKEAFFIADFYCREKKVIVEIDGGIHRTQVEYDQLRQEVLERMGYRVIRFKNEEVLENWEKVERILLEWIA